MSDNIFTGCIPALMTPCTAAREPDFDALVAKGRELIDIGMSAVVYCGSMGDWPLLTEAQRQEGVARLAAAGVPTIVGTGAVNSRVAVSHAAHAAKVGAQGLMVIPRVLSRGASATAQKAHFAAILKAAPNLPAVIYNSPYYGFATRAELFFELRCEHPNLIGCKECGGGADLRYAAEYITSQDDNVSLMVGVDTQVVHGFVNCNATGAITGVGNALPREVLQLVALSKQAAKGDAKARRQALELEAALAVLSSFDEGCDLVLYYKYLMVLNGERGYALHFTKPIASARPSVVMPKASTRCSASGTPTGRRSRMSRDNRCAAAVLARPTLRFPGCSHDSNGQAAARPAIPLQHSRRAPDRRHRRGRRGHHRRRLRLAVGTPRAPGHRHRPAATRHGRLLWQRRPPGDRASIPHRRPIDPQALARDADGPHGPAAPGLEIPAPRPALVCAFAAEPAPGQLPAHGRRDSRAE